MEISETDYIEHHGVKGMKWGKSKSSSKSARKPIVKSSPDHKEVQKLRAKQTHSLSNKEIETINKRLQLVSNNKKLDPTKVAKGKNHAQTTLATLGIGIGMYNIATHPASKVAVQLGKKLMSDKGKSLVKVVSKQ